MKKNKSLYVHIPFCAKKCLFCSFAVSIGQAHRVDDYLNALDREAQVYKDQAVDTVYLGGGTPSFLSAPQLHRLIKIIRAAFDVDANASWSIEVNPEGVGPQEAKVFFDLGFDRVSLGVQSFNDVHLKFLGRVHDRAQAINAYEALRRAGFTDINVDLMYGFPAQSRADLERDIRAVLGLDSTHVSIYTLTIDPNSRFHAVQMALDSDEKLADDYVFVTEALEKSGLAQYEVSNFAKAGFESQHNMAYWQGKEYIGLGMGAHSFVGGKRFWNVSALNIYIEKIALQGHARDDEEMLSLQTLMRERLIFGLRMNQGVDLAALAREFQQPWPRALQESINRLIGEGFLVSCGQRVCATMKGRLVLDKIAVELI